MALVEYIWIDGTQPTPALRSKMRFVNLESIQPKVSDLPLWGFDGSSTNQADGSDSDCVLVPVCMVNDPIRGEGNFLAMCEVLNDQNDAHVTNTRSKLRAVLNAGAQQQNPWAGFEQEYTLFQNGRPLGWPENGEPEAQGPYYCGVGADRIFGRDIAEMHADLCMQAGIMYYGLNAEVMPGQWEFQIGYRGLDSDNPAALNAADHVWIARWLLHRVAEDFGVTVSFANKPVKGDWNGAGMHTNFSTDATRNKDTGMEAIEAAVDALSKRHEDHIKVYGEALDERLTGLHETCSISEFRSGTADRGASIRIPLSVQQNGYGYFEDRRPGANSDPYEVAMRIMATIMNFSDSVFEKASDSAATEKAA
ncbi:MAG: glutamine synthetase beta-grasp domain-containing protein [Aestuariibacter sp.]